MSKDDVNSLIDSLSEELEPIKPMLHPVLRMLPWILFVFIFVAYGVYDEGLRFDMAERLRDETFLFEISSAMLIVLTSAMAALWLCVPDVRGQIWVVTIPIILVLHFGVWLLAKSVADGVHMPHMELGHCFYSGLYMAGIPAAVLMFITYRGATTHPYLMALMNMICASFLPYLGLRFTCPMDTVGHSFVHHIFPYVFIGMVIGALARRIFKW